MRVADKEFSVAGLRAWNALQTDRGPIKQTQSPTSFCKKLKTHI